MAEHGARRQRWHSRTGRREGRRTANTSPTPPGLDGVRAFAVAAVVVFHLGATWLAGGFLGVDVFFVLSGFLITSILLTEFFDRRRIDVKNFYLRRARRLLPALFTMLAAVTLLTWLFARDELHRLRGDVVAALTYCTNWTQIFWDRSYFDQLSRPSLLQHLWSLAVEEQFYLVWPLLLVVLLTARRRWLVLAVPSGLAVLSLVLMASLFHVGQDTSRVYYGTDTHIAPMLIGATLAIVIALRRQAGAVRETRNGRVLADGLAVAGFLVLAWSVVEVSSYSPGLYRGGYLFISLASAALIYAAGAAGHGDRTRARLGTAGLDRPAVLRDLPLALADPDALRVPAWTSTGPLDRHHHAGGAHPARLGPVLPLHRAADPLARLPRLRARQPPAPLVERRPVTRRCRAGGVFAVVAATLATAPPAPAGIQVDHSTTRTIHIADPVAHSTQADPARRHHARHGASPSSSNRRRRPVRRSRVRCGWGCSATRRA